MPFTSESSPRPSVALLVETSNAYSRELLHGIRDWIRTGAGWAIQLSEQGRGAVPPVWLKGWRGDGIIARIETDRIRKAVLATGVPVVNVSASAFSTGFPTIISDSAAVAGLAADHLIHLGLEHFGYCGDSRFQWSKKHGEHFAARIGEAKRTCNAFEYPSGKNAPADGGTRAMHRWLRQLPKPCGIMCCYDIIGQRVLDACRESGLRVPDDVAVIGQHNDDLLCELCDPPLSSVIPNARRAGFEAAALLDRLIRGEDRPREIRAIPPLGVCTRQSTDVVAVSDPGLARALKFIRTRACDGINVADVLSAVPMSRTLLERLFRETLGRTPYEEILHCRLGHALHLLRNTALPVADIAERCGFGVPERLSVVCRRLTGESPREHRRKTQMSEG